MFLLVAMISVCDIRSPKVAGRYFSTLEHERKTKDYGNFTHFRINFLTKGESNDHRIPFFNVIG